VKDLYSTLRVNSVKDLDSTLRAGSAKDLVLGSGKLHETAFTHAQERRREGFQSRIRFFAALRMT